MTPDDIVAELDAITRAVDAALDDEAADREGCLERTAARLSGLAHDIDAAGVDDVPGSGGGRAYWVRPGEGVALDPRGPHSDGCTTVLAALLAETARVLVYATGAHAAEGLTGPGTAYAVTGSLAAAASRLGQLSAQLTDFLDRELAAGRLGDGADRDAGPVHRGCGGEIDFVHPREPFCRGCLAELLPDDDVELPAPAAVLTVERARRRFEDAAGLSARLGEALSAARGDLSALTAARGV